MKLQITINGKSRQVEVSPKKRLLDILRDDLNLTGTKEGCGRGECGSCTVILNGKRVNSCLVPAFQLMNSSVLTIEGLADLPLFNEIERAFIEHGAVQCGFCMPGYAISAVTVLHEIKNPPDLEEIKFRIAGNMCRCTGYSKILDAIIDLSKSSGIRSRIEKIFK